MTSPPSVEPGPGGTCRVCGTTLPADSKVCPTCGAAWGEGNRCPHCRAVADVEPSDRLRYRCRICGGPRVPADAPDVARSGREIRLLQQARRDDIRAALLRAGGVALFGSFGMSLLVTLFVLAVATPGVIGSVAALAACAVPLLLGVYVYRKGAAARSAVKDSLDKAWLLVASDVVQGRAELPKADELAKILRIDEARAELLLAELSVNDFVHARIASEPGAPDRVRISFDDETALEVPPETEPAEKKASN